MTILSLTSSFVESTTDSRSRKSLGRDFHVELKFYIDSFQRSPLTRPDLVQDDLRPRFARTCSCANVTVKLCGQNCEAIRTQAKDEVVYGGILIAIIFLLLTFMEGG